MPANPLSAYSLILYAYGLMGWRPAPASTASDGAACRAAAAKPTRQTKAIGGNDLISRYFRAWRGWADHRPWHAGLDVSSHCTVTDIGSYPAGRS